MGEEDCVMSPKNVCRGGANTAPAQGFHYRLGTRQIDWLWQWFCPPGFIISRKVFLSKKFSNAPPHNGEERCVTSLKTAAKETRFRSARTGKGRLATQAVQDWFSYSWIQLKNAKEIKLSYFKCVRYLSLVPILVKPFWRWRTASLIAGENHDTGKPSSQ